MPTPVIAVVSVTTNRISPRAGKDLCDVVFTSDQALHEWEARADGAGLRQGLLVGFSPIQSWQQLDDLVLSFDRIEFLSLTWADLDTLKVWDNTEGLSFNAMAERTFDALEGLQVLPAAGNGSFRIDDEELTGGDKTYRINVYGKNAAGEWTAYG